MGGFVFVEMRLDVSQNINEMLKKTALKMIVISKNLKIWKDSLIRFLTSIFKFLFHFKETEIG